MIFLTLFIYIFCCYGLTILFTQTIGPKNIFFRLRLWANNVGDNFGHLFKCTTCFSTNIGWVVSLINFFIINNVKFTPSMLLFGDKLTEWYYFPIFMVIDACFNAGIIHIIWNIDDYVDKITPLYEDEVEKQVEDDVIEINGEKDSL